MAVTGLICSMCASPFCEASDEYVSGPRTPRFPLRAKVFLAYTKTVLAKMPETVSTLRAKRRRPPATRRRENLENWRVMKWLEAEIKAQNLSLREIARRMGYSNATRIREYLDQRIVPGPTVLANLATATGASPIEALWLANHREAVFGYLHSLYQLGWAWMRKDRLHLDPVHGADFIGYYTARAGGGNIPTVEDLRIVPEELRERYHQADIYNYGGFFRPIALPKPMACALMLAIGLFPRRGEYVHEQTRSFIQELGLVAVRMLPAAERISVPSELSGIQRPLKSALKILPLRFYGDMRMAIVGEYVHAWADSICKNYADYARIALYKNGSFVSESEESQNLWTWQRTSFPSAREFDVRVRTSDNTTK